MLVPERALTLARVTRIRPPLSKLQAVALRGNAAPQTVGTHTAAVAVPARVQVQVQVLMLSCWINWPLYQLALKGVDKGSLEGNFRPEFWEVFGRFQAPGAVSMW